LRLEQIPIRHPLPAIHLVAASAYRRKQATLGGDDAVALRNQIRCTACDCVFYGAARPAGRQGDQGFAQSNDAVFDIGADHASIGHVWMSDRVVAHIMMTVLRLGGSRRPSSEVDRLMGCPPT
jgi:hypothetical protein